MTSFWNFKFIYLSCICCPQSVVVRFRSYRIEKCNATYISRSYVCELYLTLLWERLKTGERPRLLGWAIGGPRCRCKLWHTKGVWHDATIDYETTIYYVRNVFSGWISAGPTAFSRALNEEASSLSGRSRVQLSTIFQVALQPVVEWVWVYSDIPSPFFRPCLRV